VNGNEQIPKRTRLTGGWTCVEAASLMLERDEREAVLGDLTEAGEGTWQATLAILGLVLRHEVDVWKIWRPWIAAFGLAVPCSFLLMGTSLSVSWALKDVFASSQGLMERQSGLPWVSVFSQVVLLAAWSWTAGFVVGSLSRRTLWVSTVCCLLPCAVCLTRFEVESLSAFCLLLFLPPALWGAVEGLRIGRIRRSRAILLAVAVAMLTIPTLRAHGEPWWNPPRWLIDLTLTWPTWYLVAISTRHRKKSDAGHHEQRNDAGGTR
jgi:hypothetical protein